MSNANVLLAFSAIAGIIVVTNPVFNNVVIISHDANAATPPVPSLSLDKPTPTPITNKSAILSIKAPPALTKNKPIKGITPLISPPCIAPGHKA